MPTCKSQNHTAMTIPYFRLCLHLNIWFLPILRPPFHSFLTLTVMVIAPHLASFSLIFPVNPALSSSWSSMNSFHVLFFDLVGSREWAYEAVLIKSTAVYRNVLGLHTQHSHRLTPSNSHSCRLYL